MHHMHLATHFDPLYGRSVLNTGTIHYVREDTCNKYLVGMFINKDDVKMRKFILLVEIPYKSYACKHGDMPGGLVQI